MTAKKSPLKETVYLSGDDAEAIRAFACESGLSNRRAMRLLILAGLQNLRDRGIEGQLERFRTGTQIRDREVLGLLSEIVLGVRFLADTQKPGMEKRLRDLAKSALVALIEKIERNEKGL